MAAKVTQCAASALVTNPVGCMVGLMATTVLAANYEHIIPVVKGTVGSVLYIDEYVSDAVMSDFTIDLSEEFPEIGILTC